MTDLIDKKDNRGNVKLSPELHRELSHYAVDEGVSIAEVVRRGWAALNAVPKAESGTVPTPAPMPAISGQPEEQLAAFAAQLSAVLTELKTVVGELKDGATAASEEHNRNQSKRSSEETDRLIEKEEGAASEDSQPAKRHPRRDSGGTT